MRLHKIAEDMIHRYESVLGECDIECKRTCYIKAYELMKLKRI